MHKSELLNHVKYTHPTFGSSEWVMFRGLIAIFEDGCSMTIEEFWNIRNHENFDNQWSEYF
jgi:hypothetical protein